jgi:hypothetical protein
MERATTTKQMPKNLLSKRHVAATRRQVVNSIEELRVIASRDFVPAALRGDVAANTAPLAKKLAAPKRRIAEMTTLNNLELQVAGAKNRGPAIVVEQYVHHPHGFTTATSQTTLAGNTEPTSFGVNLYIGGMMSVRSAHTVPPEFAKTVNSMLYSGQYVVQAASGELSKPTGTISLTWRSFTDKNGVDRRLPSNSAATTISRDVGEIKPASNLHPRLQGNAVRLTCKSSVGRRPTSQSNQWYLEDYQWYVRQSETWETGSSTRTIKDVVLAAEK